MYIQRESSVPMHSKRTIFKHCVTSRNPGNIALLFLLRQTIFMTAWVIWYKWLIVCWYITRETVLCFLTYYSDVIMRAMASQITGVLTVCSTVCSGADQRTLQSSASLALVRGIHRWPVNSPHKGPVTRKMFLFGDVIVVGACHSYTHIIVDCSIVSRAIIVVGSLQVEESYRIIIKLFQTTWDPFY